MFKQFVKSQFPWNLLFWNLLFSLNPGDHIAVDGQFGNLKYYHHGIFISHKEGVVEFGGSKKIFAVVRNVTLDQFTDNRRKQLKRINHTSFYPPSCVVNTAKSMYANKIWNVPYGALTNNCEHFATYCKTGRAESKQVQHYFQYNSPY